MEQTFRELQQWLEDLQNFNLPDWNQLPEIDLYMDQVISFLEKKMEAMAGEDDKKVTSFMINNYVKGGVIKAPNQKKYGREQLASLFIICFMKQILSLKDVARILRVNDEFDDSKQALYDYFTKLHAFTITEACEIVKPVLQTAFERYESRQASLESDNPVVSQEIARRELTHIAMQMAVQAEIYQVIAEKILHHAAADIKDAVNEETKEEVAIALIPPKPTKRQRKVAKKVAKRERKAAKKKADDEIESLE